MRVSVLQENLARGLSIVTRAVSPRSALPVLANVLVATDEGRLRLSATNLELGITCWIGAKIHEEGSTTVPARVFSDLVSTLPSGSTVDMALTVRTQTLNVRCGNSNTDLKCIDAQEFPPMPVVDESQGLQINAQDFKEMIQQVVFAASTDDARPVLTGVLVNVGPRGDKEVLTLAAADGFRLSVRRLNLSAPLERPINVIVPARALSELARILSDGEKPLTMVISPTRAQVIFRHDDVEVVSQLIDGTYPNIEQIIPQSCETRAVLSTTAFLKACKQAEIFAREGSLIARLNIQPGGEMKPGVVEISGQSEETGFNQNLVDANIEGPGLLIAFNVRFLREVLDVIRTPNVALEINAEDRPGVIRPVEVGDGQGEFVHVIMPMKLGG